MIDKVDILHKGHCCDFTSHSGKKSGTTPLRGTFPRELTRFPAKSLQISRIHAKFVMK